MEFFEIVEIEISETKLQECLQLQSIDEWCASIFPLSEETEECLIGSNWGEFTLRRDTIRGGVRFSMMDCPNALVWTITTGYPPKKNAIVIHSTINRFEKDQDFLDEWKGLLLEMKEGLNELLGR